MSIGLKKNAEQIAKQQCYHGIESNKQMAL